MLKVAADSLSADGGGLVCEQTTASSKAARKSFGWVTPPRRRARSRFVLARANPRSRLLADMRRREPQIDAIVICNTPLENQPGDLWKIRTAGGTSSQRSPNSRLCVRGTAANATSGGPFGPGNEFNLQLEAWCHSHEDLDLPSQGSAKGRVIQREFPIWLSRLLSRLPA